VPEDAEVAGHTWLYTREDGSPDRRYKPNPQLPVVLYGLLRLTGPSGLDISLQVSNRTAAATFAGGFGVEVKREKSREERPRKEAYGADEQEKNKASAERTKAEPVECPVLGVREDAPMNEITAAYRKLARTYHPDKVAHLSPEAREFADNKMKEINAAYAELKRRRKQPPPILTGEQTNGRKEEERA